MGKDGLLRKRGSEDRRGTFRESAFTTPEFNSAHKVLSYFYCVGTLRTVVHALTSTDRLFSRYPARRCTNRNEELQFVQFHVFYWPVVSIDSVFNENSINIYRYRENFARQLL